MLRCTKTLQKLCHNVYEAWKRLDKAQAWVFVGRTYIVSGELYKCGHVDEAQFRSSDTTTLPGWRHWQVCRMSTVTRRLLLLLLLLMMMMMMMLMSICQSLRLVRCRPRPQSNRCTTLTIQGRSILQHSNSVDLGSARPAKNPVLRG